MKQAVSMCGPSRPVAIAIASLRLHTARADHTPACISRLPQRVHLSWLGSHRKCGFTSMSTQNGILRMLPTERETTRTYAPRPVIPVVDTQDTLV
jgi:hypothetical protein